MSRDIDTEDRTERSPSRSKAERTEDKQEAEQLKRFGDRMRAKVEQAEKQRSPSRRERQALAMDDSQRRLTARQAPAGWDRAKEKSPDVPAHRRGRYAALQQELLSTMRAGDKARKHGSYDAAFQADARAVGIMRVMDRCAEPVQRGAEPVQRGAEPVQRGAEPVQRGAEPVQRGGANRAARTPVATQDSRTDTTPGQQPDRTQTRSDPAQADRIAGIRERVKEARAQVRGWRENSVSQTTRDRYAKMRDHLASTGKTPEQAAGTTRSYYSYRAAVVHGARSDIQAGLREREQALRGERPDYRAAAAAEAKVFAAAAVLERYPPSTGDHAQDRQRDSRYRGPAHSSRSNGKRDALGDRPSDWRDRIWGGLADRDRDAVAVAALAGARPAELAKGVEVRRTLHGLDVTIRGAKVSRDGTRGYRSRTISISREEAEKSPEGRHLLDRTAQSGRGHNHAFTAKLDSSPAAFSNRVRAVSARVLPDEKSTVSPYDYRHAFSARLKSDDSLTRREKADALGQRSVESQEAYGLRGSAGKAGAGRISGARAGSGKGRSSSGGARSVSDSLNVLK